MQQRSEAAARMFRRQLRRTKVLPDLRPRATDPSRLSRDPVRWQQGRLSVAVAVARSQIAARRSDRYAHPRQSSDSVSCFLRTRRHFRKCQPPCERDKPADAHDKHCHYPRDDAPHATTRRARRAWLCLRRRILISRHCIPLQPLACSPTIFTGGQKKSDRRARQATSETLLPLP